MATRKLPVAVPRETLSARIEALSLPQAKGYADFIRTGDATGPIPCWGAIAERFQQDFTTDDDRKALWTVLLEDGDRRPLLMFLHTNRDRPQVMAQVLADADRLPRALQRALVSFDEVADQLPAHLDKLDPAARQLVEAGPEALGRERELVEARMAQLTAFRYFVPDTFDPANEPGGKAPTDASPVIDQPAPGGTAPALADGLTVDVLAPTGGTRGTP